LAVATLAVPTAARAAEGGLNLFPDWPLVVANLVVFALLIYPVHRLLIGPLIEVLAERERRSRGALEQAAQLGEESAAQRRGLEARLIQARGEAQALRGSILGEARSEEQRLLDVARQEAAAELGALRAGIAAEAEQARGQLRAEAQALAHEAAARVLGRPL
jgi:F-type H+-transporting ATPase subunit b